MFLPLVSGTLSQVMMRSAHAYQQSQLLASSADGGDAAWIAHVPDADRQRWKETIEADEINLQRQYEEKRKRERGKNRDDGDHHQQQQQGATPLDEEKRSLYRPLSYAYQAGGKKRPAATSAAAALPSAASAPSVDVRASVVPSGSIGSTAASADSSSDTRIGDNLVRTLKRAIQTVQHATTNISSGTNALSDDAESTGLMSRVLTELPTDLQEQYTQQIASDLRTTIQTHFRDDYNPQRFPNIEAQIMQTGEKK
jgi:hypothetical protein